METQQSQQNQKKSRMDVFEKEAYDLGFSTSERYNGHYSQTEYYGMWKIVINELSPTDNILELGCGTGQLAHMMHDFGIRNYVGIDFSSAAISRAKINVPSFTFIEADLRTYEFKDCSNCRIICTETFEHINDDISLIKKLPKTDIIFSVPNYMSENHYRVYENEEYIVKYYEGVMIIEDIKTFNVSDINKIFIIKAKIK